MNVKWSVMDVQDEELERELNTFAANGYEIFDLFRYVWHDAVRFRIVARKLEPHGPPSVYCSRWGA